MLFLAASQEKLGFIFTQTTNMKNMPVKKFAAVLIEHCKKNLTVLQTATGKLKLIACLKDKIPFLLHRIRKCSKRIQNPLLLKFKKILLPVIKVGFVVFIYAIPSFLCLILTKTHLHPKRFPGPTLQSLRGCGMLSFLN